MTEKFKERTKIVIGEEGIDKLAKARVIVFGVGGVGGFTVEALVRAGIENLTVVDFDTIDETNINRQVIALHSNIGRDKVEVIKERALDINPNINIVAKKVLFDETNAEELLSEGYDYVVDAIDMVKSKIHLIEESYKRGYKIISSMGMGNKLDPTMIEIADIHKTEMCPLAKVIRKEAKKRGIKKLKVVYSKEKPLETGTEIEDGRVKRVNGSTSFVPSVGGLVIASYVVRDIIKDNKN